MILESMDEFCDHGLLLVSTQRIRSNTSVLSPLSSSRSLSSSENLGTRPLTIGTNLSTSSREVLDLSENSTPMTKHCQCDSMPLKSLAAGFTTRAYSGAFFTLFMELIRREDNWATAVRIATTPWVDPTWSRCLNRCRIQGDSHATI